MALYSILSYHMQGFASDAQYLIVYVSKKAGRKSSTDGGGSAVVSAVSTDGNIFRNFQSR